MGKNSSHYHRSWHNREGFSKDGYDEYEDYDGFGPWYGHGHRSTNSENDIYKAVEPLIRHIKIYDKFRQKLEKQGGTIEDFATIVTILTKEICLEGGYGQTNVTLKDPGAIRYALFDIDYRLGYRIRLQVRELHSGLPGYYICRTIDIHYASYSLIVEDLYCSPGYPMPDKRFVRLMKGGKEESFLRVSPFRAEIKKRIQDKKDQNRSIDRETDRIFYNSGCYVLGPAWHEDQFPGMQAANHFELRRFPQVIELLYLVLSGELCELRGQIDTDMLDIFRATIRQPAIFGFLKKLIDLNGAELNDLPKEALAHYVSLLNAFSKFLGIEVPWGRRKTKMPLNKLLLGNFSRLDLVAKALNQSKEALKAKKRLEDQATKIISMMTQKKQKAQEC